ncbi:MAG: nuclear transport factor 2 family protein [Nocardioides sp.]
MDLQELTDRQQIVDLITAYTRAVDTRSFDSLDHVFTDDAMLDYSPVGGPKGPPSEVVPWIEQGLAGFDRYQHLIGQVSIELSGDTASATAYFTNPMVSVGPDGTEKLWEVGGYYHHELVRTSDGWRSRGIQDDVVWTRGF